MTDAPNTVDPRDVVAEILLAMRAARRNGTLAPVLRLRAALLQAVALQIDPVDRYAEAVVALSPIAEATPSRQSDAAAVAALRVADRVLARPPSSMVGAYVVSGAGCWGRGASVAEAFDIIALVNGCPGPRDRFRVERVYWPSRAARAAAFLAETGQPGFTAGTCFVQDGGPSAFIDDATGVLVRAEGTEVELVWSSCVWDGMECRPVEAAPSEPKALAHVVDASLRFGAAAGPTGALDGTKNTRGHSPEATAAAAWWGKVYLGDIERPSTTGHAKVDVLTSLLAESIAENPPAPDAFATFLDALATAIDAARPWQPLRIAVDYDAPPILVDAATAAGLDHDMVFPFKTAMTVADGVVVVKQGGDMDIVYPVLAYG